ncbi:MAG: ferritin-like domain-containing protein [Dehalococcoidia bacterium]|nr:ferritin-like domain-containing protein [Dehalococcoidia bacterium]
MENDLYTPMGKGPGTSAEDWVKFYSSATVWQEIRRENEERLKRGSWDLRWLKPNGEVWGTKVNPGPHGLTFVDINRQTHLGEIAEHAEFKNMAPRGSIREPYKGLMPEFTHYDLTEKFEVWSESVTGLYEEAKARQWNAATDIPWDELEPLPEDLERAACQFATFLTEVEFVAGDFPSIWMHRIPNEFFEVKAFLASQMTDEARHAEVFRKRAVANGGGLLHAGAGFEWALKAILDAPSHTLGTFLLNILAEGLVLSMFRAGEFLAKTRVDKEIFRRCMQDEARHVSYGTMHLKYFLENAPDKEKALEIMHGYADIGEQVILTALTEPLLLEPLAVLMGDGVKNIDQGLDGVRFLWATMVEEYLQRCDRAGLSRRDQVKIPLEFPA